MKICIRQGSEYLEADESGRISRPEIGMPASGQWLLLGAVTRNNFGHATRYYSLADILAGAKVPGKFKNGAQRSFVVDLDHGTRREWRNPAHSLQVLP